MESSAPGRESFEEGQGGDRNRPFYPKRSHKKSRKGCINCKTRKVKCDEGLPSCRACLLRHDRCVYVSAAAAARAQARKPLTFIQAQFPPAQASTVSTPSPRTLSNPSTPPLQTTDSLGILSPSPMYDTVDLKLLWNYTMKTLYSFLVDESYQELTKTVYRKEVVAIAFDAPFLMHSILSVSCLELQGQDPDFSLSRAYRYHVKAVEGYNRAIQEARPEMLPAILVNTVFIALMTTHTFRDPNAKDLYITDWIFVWTGMTGIVELVGFEVIFKSGLGICLYRPPIDLEASALAIPDYLNFMITSIPLEDEDYPHRAAYMAVLNLLGSLYLHLKIGLGPDLDQRICSWLSYLPRAFTNLAKQHRPRALIILAHYAAFVKIVRCVWWTSGIAERSTSDVAKHLSPEWRSMVQLPLIAAHTQSRVEIARILLQDPTWENATRSRTEIEETFLYLSEEDQATAATALLEAEQNKDLQQDKTVDAEISRQLSQTQI